MSEFESGLGEQRLLVSTYLGETFVKAVEGDIQALLDLGEEKVVAERVREMRRENPSLQIVGVDFDKVKFREVKKALFFQMGNPSPGLLTGWSPLFDAFF